MNRVLSAIDLLIDALTLGQYGLHPLDAPEIKAAYDQWGKQPGGGWGHE